MRVLFVLISLFLVGCATPLTPEQQLAKVKGMDDYSLCNVVARGNLTGGFEVMELQTRKLNCKLYQSQIISERRQEIQSGIMMMALSDSLAGRPVQQRSVNSYPLPTWFPDYSTGELTPSMEDLFGSTTYTAPPVQPQGVNTTPQPTVKTLTLTSIKKMWDESWQCMYGVGVDITYQYVPSNGTCPQSIVVSDNTFLPN